MHTIRLNFPPKIAELHVICEHFVNLGLLYAAVRIRKYGSTFYVGTGRVKNGRLCLRYGSSSEKTAAELAKTLTDKRPLL